MSENNQRPLRWRLVFLIQRLITLLFPPLHSIRWKLFIFHLIVLVAPVAYFAMHMVSAGGVHYESSREQRIVHEFIWRELRELALPGFIGLALATLLAATISYYISRVIGDLAQRAERIAAGEPGVRLETWSKSELGMLARSFEKMRRKLEGKAYVEEMATNLSHELKTPLAAIRGAAELLEDGAVDEPAARKKFLGNIQGEVRRLDRLVNDLITLSRIETHPDDRATADADIVPLVRELAAACAERAESLGIRFNAQLPEQPVPARISPQQLRLLVTSLLDNALQFTPAGRAVTLALEGRELRVTDEGAGIDPEILPKIFNRFFTTENPRTGERGSGLGLAIAKSIATAHHAAIDVTSTPGKGSAFTVRFGQP